VAARGLDLAADLPQPPVRRPRAVLAVEQRDEPLSAHQQAAGGERVIARPAPPATKQAQVSGEAGLHVVRRHRAGLQRRETGGSRARLQAVVTAARPAATRNAPARTRTDSTSVQAHADLPGSPEHLLRPSIAGRQRLLLRETAAQSCATSLDDQLALALTLALHPRSRRTPGTAPRLGPHSLVSDGPPGVTRPLADQRTGSAGVPSQ
jgi:hypothetical protein